MRRRKSSLPSSITAAALCALPAWAFADEGDLAASTGVAFSASFGKHIEVGVGFDLRLTVLTKGDAYESCSYYPRSGAGPYVQAGWYSRTGWRVGVGTHGGGEVKSNMYGLAAEFGWSYMLRAEPLPSGPRNQGRGSHALHLGFLAQITPPKTVALGLQLPVALDLPIAFPERRPLFTTGLGVRVPPLFGVEAQTCAVGGRPLRDGGALILPDVELGAPCERRIIDEEAAAVLAEAWLLDARFECASVPSFLGLARDLLAVGAPPALIEQALFAAEDEVRHTLLCSQLASSYAGISASPQLPPIPELHDLDRQSALCRLAREAWLDGCLGEGAAAAQAARAQRTASDVAARQTQSVIARDEARHAELAWSVLAFCLAAGGRAVKDAVAPLMIARHEPPPGCPREAASPSLLRAHGRLSQGEAEAIWMGNSHRARARAATLFAV